MAGPRDALQPFTHINRRRLHLSYAESISARFNCLGPSKPGLSWMKRLKEIWFIITDFWFSSVFAFRGKLKMCEYLAPAMLSSECFYDRQNEASYEFMQNGDQKVAASISSCKLDHRQESVSRFFVLRDADSTVVDFGMDVNSTGSGSHGQRSPHAFGPNKGRTSLSKYQYQMVWFLQSCEIRTDFAILFNENSSDKNSFLPLGSHDTNLAWKLCLSSSICRNINKFVAKTPSKRQFVWNEVAI